MSVFVQPIGIVILFALVSIHTKAMVCQMGQEPDSNTARRYRWVIPVEDPCKCTEIRPGGINNRTPGRHFNVIYFDTLLVSNSPMEIRKWLNCSDAFSGNQINTPTTSSVTNGKLMSSVPASQPEVHNSHATGHALVTGDTPVTSDKPGLRSTTVPSDEPVTSFNCTGRDNGKHYADPYDSTMFYHCDNSVAQHRPCSPGTRFDELDHTCKHDGVL